MMEHAFACLGEMCESRVSGVRCRNCCRHGYPTAGSRCLASECQGLAQVFSLPRAGIQRRLKFPVLRFGFLKKQEHLQGHTVCSYRPVMLKMYMGPPPHLRVFEYILLHLWEFQSKKPTTGWS